MHIIYLVVWKNSLDAVVLYKLWKTANNDVKLDFVQNDPL